jgi:hypothetical protein
MTKVGLPQVLHWLAMPSKLATLRAASTKLTEDPRWEASCRAISAPIPSEAPVMIMTCMKKLRIPLTRLKKSQGKAQFKREHAVKA